MRTVRGTNNESFVIDDTIEVAVYPKRSDAPADVLVLGLIREDGLVEIVDGTESLAGMDAAVTENKNVSLGVATKDCAPICIGDGKKIAIAHVGWQGFSLGLTEKVLSYFEKEDAVVYVGPFLHSFEIQRDFCYDALVQKPGTEQYIREENGKLIFHFQEALADLLPPQTVFDERNTFTDPILPSHRRDKNAENFLTTVRFSKSKQ